MKAELRENTLVVKFDSVAEKRALWHLVNRRPGDVLRECGANRHIVCPGTSVVEDVMIAVFRVVDRDLNSFPMSKCQWCMMPKPDTPAICPHCHRFPQSYESATPVETDMKG